MRRETEAFESHPINLHHLIPVDFNTVLKLPDSHIWFTSSTTLDHTSISPPSSVPVIDMNDSNALQLMKTACEEWGMFQIINHGIALEVLQKMEDQTRKLFSLPTEQKLQTLRLQGELTGYGLARISPFFSKLMWSEGFTIQGSPSEDALLLWPHDSAAASFCDVINEYQEAVKGLSQKILNMMLMSLGVTQDDVKWLSPSTQPILQLNSYPICPDSNKAMGLAPHTDSSLITLLYQNNTRGLQVSKDKVGGWINVEPIYGALVVIIGDLFQILSNGIFKSARHQVVVNEAQHRFSIAYFDGPPKNVDISPPTSLVERGRLPMYRPITWKEYLDVKACCFNKALDLIRSH